MHKMLHCFGDVLFFMISFYDFFFLMILVDFTYPSLEEPAPFKPAAQMPSLPIDIDESMELINDQDDRAGPLNTSAPTEPIVSSKSDGLPIIQPVPIIKNVPLVCS